MLNIGYLFHPSCCGYYCLKYIFKKYKIVFDRSIKRGYLSLYDVKTFLEKEGFNSKCYKVSNTSYLTNKNTITLLKINKISYHYVVIIKISKKHVFYYDPLFITRKKKNIRRFLKKWTGICCIYDRESKK